MRKSRLLWIAILTALCFISIPRTAHAYIDPGTTGNVFAMLAPFIAIILVFLGFVIRPFRDFFASIVRKLRGGPAKESVNDDEQSVLDHSPDTEENGEDISEEPEP